MDVFEILYLGNKAAAFAMDLADRVQSGDMTEDEAVAAWKLNAGKVAAEGVRFERLTGDDSSS